MSNDRFTPAIEVIQKVVNGSTCAVLVEGEERGGDAQILKTILLPHGNVVTFHGRDGRNNLVKELPEFVTELAEGKVAAILDRDFMEPAEVEATYQLDYEGHLFYWQRYCIENYLLEPKLIANCIMMTHSLKPETAPVALATEPAIENYILDWSQKVSPQVAGNWVIHDLTIETDSRALGIEAPHYFENTVARDKEWVLEKLNQTYSMWAKDYPILFGASSLSERFESRLQDVSEKVKTLEGCYQLVDGKRFLKPIILREVPPALRGYFFSLLVELAAKNPPEDPRLLVEDRILPRWRKARAASTA